MSKEDAIEEAGKILRELFYERGISLYKIVIFGSYVKGLQREG